MGAYSSFAMLALTHHVIVKIASRRAGFTNFNHYMVLGDDGAMANKRVAKHYIDLFEYLGMTINPIKGFTGCVLEFAKQLHTVNGYNISPLGAKNVLLAIRFIEFLPMVLYELWVKRFPLFLNKSVKNFNKVGLAKFSNYWLERYIGTRNLAVNNLDSRIIIRSRTITHLSERYMGKSTDSSGTLKPGWFTIDTKPFIKEVNRNIFKRIDLFMVQIPLINFQNLFYLTSSLFFNSGRKGKAKIAFIRKDFIGPLTYQDTINIKESIDITTKIKLRVLMAIGPKSGLWYPSLHVINYLYGNGILFFYRNMFCLAVYYWFENRLITKKSLFKIALLERIKYNSYSRIHVVNTVFKALKDF
jgi:hypothetical protein